MSASLQYWVKYSAIGAIFDKVEISDKREVTLQRSTGENRYSMKVDLSDLFEQVLSENDFDEIYYLQTQIENLTLSQDLDEAAAFQRELSENYTTEQLANYKEFDGDYTDYAHYLGKHLIDNLGDFTNELEDNDVFVETWL